MKCYIKFIQINDESEACSVLYLFGNENKTNYKLKFPKNALLEGEMLEMESTLDLTKTFGKLEGKYEF